MPRKRNLNWPEIKARYLAGELPARIAKDYVDCTRNMISTKATRQKWTQARAEIESVVTEQTKEALAASAAIDRDALMQEIRAIAFSDMKDYVTIDEGGGVQLKTFDEMPAGASRVIKKVRERRKILSAGEGSGDNVVIDSVLDYEFYDKLKAMEILGKWCGFDKEEEKKPDAGNNVLTLKISRPAQNEGVLEDAG